MIHRYVNEMTSAIGNKGNLDLNFLAMIERCFGEKVAKAAEKKLAAVSNSN